MRISIKRLTPLFIIIILLTACKPSDKYVGEWYALSNTNEKVIINFSKEKKLTIIDEKGNEEQATFNQTSAGFINKVSYYGIQMDNGYYYIVFDNKKDELNAKLIHQTNVASDFEDVVGDILFTMNRENYPEE